MKPPALITRSCSSWRAVVVCSIDTPLQLRSFFTRVPIASPRLAIVSCPFSISAIRQVVPS